MFSANHCAIALEAESLKRSMKVYTDQIPTRLSFIGQVCEDQKKKHFFPPSFPNQGIKTKFIWILQQDFPPTPKHISDIAAL